MVAISAAVAGRFRWAGKFRNQLKLHQKIFLKPTQVTVSHHLSGALASVRLQLILRRLIVARRNAWLHGGPGQQCRLAARSANRFRGKGVAYAEVAMARSFCARAGVRVEKTTLTACVGEVNLVLPTAEAAQVAHKVLVRGCCGSLTMRVEEAPLEHRWSRQRAKIIESTRKRLRSSVLS